MSELFGSSFQGKQVLVTGHTGFKGAWLSLWLKRCGAEVTGYALDPEYTRGIFAMCELADKIIDIRGDIRDLPRLMDVFREHAPDIVFHLAAQPLVKRSYKIPRETYETNVMGTVNVLECVRNSPRVRAFVNVTTDKCYENRSTVEGYKESDPMGGHDPYSSSKGCSELVTLAYQSSFFCEEDGDGTSTAVATVRSGNVVGGGDWAQDRLVPDSIRALAENQPIKSRSPLAVRPWIHVLETLGGYLMLTARMLTDKESFSGPWNFGPSKKTIHTVEDIVEMIIDCWGEGAWQDVSDEDHPHEASLLNLDTTKVRSRLGWRPVLDTRETVEMTVAWYRACINGTDMSGFTEDQLREYEQRLIKAKGSDDAM